MKQFNCGTRYDWYILLKNYINIIYELYNDRKY
jgi:hypothetical protein